MSSSFVATTVPRGFRSGWRRSAALVAAFASSLLGLGALSQVVGSPAAQAAPWTTDAAGADTVGAFAQANPSTLGRVAPASNQTGTTGTIGTIDDNTLYGIDVGTWGNTAAIATTPNASGQAVPTTLWATSASANSDQSTMAMDGGGNGQRTPGMYTWYWGGRNNASGCSGNTFPLYYWQEGASAPTQVYCVPSYNYFGAGGLNDSYFSGGGLNQVTGDVYFSTGECNTLGNTTRDSTRLEIFDPSTMTTYWSGQLQPATPADAIFAGVSQTSCGGNGYVASGMALDALGNYYLLVNGLGNTAVPASAPYNTTGQTIPAGSNYVAWLVKVTPSFNNQPWTYQIVTSVWNGVSLTSNTGAPSLPGGSWPQNFFTTHHYGTAFLGGQLYVVSDANLTVINPLTGIATYVGRTVSASGDPAGSTFYDLGSTQTAMDITGTVYNDASASGVYSSSDATVPGVQMALYETGGSKNYAQPTLISVQNTNASGEYNFLVPDLASENNAKYYVRMVQPQIGGVNAVQTFGQVTTSTQLGQENTATMFCGAGGHSDITGAGNGSTVSKTCAGTLASPYIDPTVGALGSTASLSSFPTYAEVTMNNTFTVPAADFGITATGSFGDAAAGPSSTQGGFPVHINGLADDLYLGSQDGQIYTAPATDNTSHNTTDDGVYINGAAGAIPLQGTTLAATHNYTSLTADIAGSSDCTSTACYLSAWTTEAGGSTWSAAPVWPTAGSPTTVTKMGPQSWNYQFQTSGSVTSGATAQLRVSASLAPQTKADNSLAEYQATASTVSTANWVTPGEIEDYSFNLADAVYRPAAVASSGAVNGTVTINSTTITMPATATTAPTYGAAVGQSAGSQTFSASTTDSNYYVASLAIQETDKTPAGTTTVLKTCVGAEVTACAYSLALGDDVTVLATLSPNPDATKSTLTVDQTTTGIGQDITATATIVDSAGTPISGQLVTFGITAPATFDPAGTNTCTTDGSGTCSVKVTSLTGGDYQVSATVPVSGVDTALKNSPVSVTFSDVIDCAIPANAAKCVVDLGKSSFDVAPITDPADTSFTNWPVSDGTAHYTGTITLRNSDGAKLAHMPMDDMAWVPSSTAVNAVKVDEVFGAGGALTGSYTGSFNTNTPGSEYTAQGEYGKGGTGFQPVGAPDVRPIPFKPGQGPCKYDPAVCNPDPTKSLFDVTPVASNTDTTHANWVASDGATPYNAKVTLMTASGQPVYGAPLADIALVPSASAVSATASASLIDDGTGNYLGTFTAVAPGTYTAKAQYNGTDIGSPVITKDIPFQALVECTYGVDPNCTPDATHSDFAVAITPGSSTPPIANGYESYTGTVTLRTADDTLVLGYTPLTDIAFTPSTGVDATATAASAAHGQYTTTFTSEAASASYFTGATFKNAPIGPAGAAISLPIPFQPELQCNYDPVKCVPDPTNSLFTVAVPVGQADPPNADGSQSWIGTVTLKKANGALVVGAPLPSITFQVPTAVHSSDPVAGTNTGTYTTQFTTLSASPDYTAGASWDGTPIGPTGARITRPIPFAGSCAYTPGTSCVPDPTQSTFTVSPVANPADQSTWPVVGSGSYTGTVTLMTASGVLVTGDAANIGFTLNSTQVQASAATEPATPDGTYTTTITSSTADSSYTVLATLKDAAGAVSPIGPAPSGTVLPVPFKAGSLDQSKSVFTVSPTSGGAGYPVTADGSSAYTGTVTAYDSQGNLLKNLDPADFTYTIAGAPSGGSVSVTGKSTDNQGHYYVKFTSVYAATTYTVAASYGVTQITGSNPTDGATITPATPIPFQAGPVVGPGPVCNDGRVKTSTTIDSASQAAGTPANVTVYATDKDCNPAIDATVIFTPTGQAFMGQASMKIDSTGHATTTVNDYTAQQVTVTTSSGSANTGSVQTTFTAGPPATTCVAGAPQCTSLTVSPTLVQLSGTAAGTSTATALVTDQYGNAVTTPTAVTFSVSSPSGTATMSPSAPNTDSATGKATSTLSDSTPETVTVTAKLGSTAISPAAGVQVTFQTGSVSGTNSSFVCAPAGASNPPVADGLDSWTCTATMKDNNNVLLKTLSTAGFSFDVTGGVDNTRVIYPLPTSKGDGTYTVAFTTTMADANYKVAASYAGVSITGAPTVTPATSIPFQAGAPVPPNPVDPICSDGRLVTKTAASQPTQTAGQPVTITTLVTDKYCNPVPNAEVTWTVSSASGSANVNPTTLTTGASGTVTTPLNDNVAELANVSASETTKGVTQNAGSATVQFQAGPPVAVCPANPSACSNLTAITPVQVGGNSDVTAKVTDALGNPISGVTVTFGVTSPSGNASVATTPGSVTAQTDATGTAKATATDLKAEAVQVTATIDIAGTATPLYGSPADVVFQAGGFSGTKSTFTVSPLVSVSNKLNWPTADGNGFYTGTIEAKDLNGNPLTGLTGFTFNMSSYISCGGTPCVVTESTTTPGTYTVTFKTIHSDPNYTVSVAYNGIPITGQTLLAAPQPASALIPFKAGPPIPPDLPNPTCPDGRNKTNTLAAPATTGVGPMGASSGSLVQTLVTDANCNPVEGAVLSYGGLSNATVAPTTAPGVTPDSFTTNAQGIATANLTDTLAETVTLTTTVTPPVGGGTGTTDGGSATVTFTAGSPVVKDCAPSAQVCTHLTATTPVQVDNPSTATAVITDYYGNVVANSPVTFSVTSASNGAHLTSTAAVETNGNGIATVTLTDSKAEIAQVSATIPVNGVETAVSGSPFSVEFTAKGISGAASTFACAPTSGSSTPPVADDNDSYTCTMTANDDNGNPLTGLAGSLKVSPSSAYITVGAVTEVNAITQPGVYTVTLKTVVANTDTPADNGYTAYATDGSINLGTQPDGTVVPVPFQAGPPVGPGPDCTTPIVRPRTNLKAVPTSLQVEQNSTTTVLLTDVNCNPVPDAAITFSVTGSAVLTPVSNAPMTTTPAVTATTGKDGKATATLTDKKAETVTVSGAYGASGVGSEAVTFTPGAPKPGPFVCIINGVTVQGTHMSADPTSLTAGDQSTATALVTDADCNPVPGVDVAFAVTGSATLSPTSAGSNASYTTGEDGQATAFVTDRKAEKVTVSGTFNAGVDPVGTADITFTPGAPKPGPFVCIINGVTVQGTSMSADPTSLVARRHSTATALVTDENCNPVPGVDVAFATTGSATLSPTATGSYTTGADGKATADVTDEAVEKVTVSGTFDSGADAVGTADITFTSRPTKPVVDPTNGSQITGKGDPGDKVIVTDSNGNVVPGCENTVADSTGAFKCVPTTPIKPGNTLTVTAESPAGDQSDPVSVPVVGLSIKIAYDTRYVGDQQTVTGYNFNPGETVQLTFGPTSLNLGHQVADATGTVVFNFTVPQGLSVAKYNVTLMGPQSGSVTDSFNVTVKIVAGGYVANSAGLAAGAGVAGLTGLWLAIAAFRRREEDAK